MNDDGCTRPARHPLYRMAPERFRGVSTRGAPRPVAVIPMAVEAHNVEKVSAMHACSRLENKAKQPTH
jgi:hypothetical protein